MNQNLIFINTFLKSVKAPHYVISNKNLKDIFYEIINYDGDRNDYNLYWRVRNYWVNEGILMIGRGPGGSIGLNPSLSYDEVLTTIEI
jgi:hypothetical protein